MDYKQRYLLWLDRANDPIVKQQLLDMQHDTVAQENAFYQELEFGTAGLRGIMGAGSACLNYYTVLKSTEGLAQYMVSHNMSSLAVTYDSRHNSQYFAELVCRAMASHDIVCYLTAECQPTPYLSYFARALQCDMGVNITASHNPSQYNGYKVYDNTGCQILDEQADVITNFINAVDPFALTIDALEQYIANGMIHYTTDEMLDNYLQSVIANNIHKANNIKVMYTPLNGAGHAVVPRVLKAVGVEHIDIVSEQSYPHGDFATCTYPNPEKAEAMALAIERANECGSDIVIGTDPDSDRLGVAVLHGGRYIQLSGNDVGVLMCDYILDNRAQQGTLPTDGVVVRTIVSSPMIDKLCLHYGIEVREVLTGFKYIGNIINALERNAQQDRFVFGFEESCGYLVGTSVRDKDAVVASMLMAEIASHHKAQGITLIDRLAQLCQQYGTYQYLTLSYRFEGAEGAEDKDRLLANIRQAGIAQLAGRPVVQARDYLCTQIEDLPRADVLSYKAEDGTKLIIRPSGTEPLIKCYITVCGTPDDNNIAIKAIKDYLDSTIVS